MTMFTRNAGQQYDFVIVVVQYIILNLFSVPLTCTVYYSILQGPGQLH